MKLSGGFCILAQKKKKKKTKNSSQECERDLKEKDRYILGLQIIFYVSIVSLQIVSGETSIYVSNFDLNRVPFPVSLCFFNIHLCLVQFCVLVLKEKKKKKKMEGTEQWKNQLEQWKNQLEPWKNQATQWLNQGIEYSHQIPPTQLYAALAVLLFTTLFFLLSIALSLSLSLSHTHTFFETHSFQFFDVQYIQ